ncbi:MAG: DUF2384 domain-containing protein [Deltaproteobacteria bacterium]|nr:DUF2384 domain-containing protein [Deltaproteobacteria bacterium]
MKSTIYQAQDKFLKLINPLKLYQASPVERIRRIKQGVDAQLMLYVIDSLGMPKQHFYKILGLPIATMNRKVHKNEQLSIEQGERIFGIIKLIGQVQTMVNQSGESKGFNAAKWVANWINEPLSALGGKRPSDYMDTIEGQELVANLLARIQSGAYA